MVMTLRSTKQTHLAAIWLPMVFGAILLMQIIASGHAHEESFDATPEASCAICVHGSQSDDLDLPISMAVPEGVGPETWVAPVIERHLANFGLAAKARAPPYS